MMTEETKLARQGAAKPERRFSVLFICTANICRSPMAAGLFSARLKAEREDWQEWKVDSAGTWAREGDPAAKNSQLVLAQRGVDISGHRSKSVTRDMLADYALILTMEPGHKEALQVEFPEIADRVFMLSEMAGESSPVMDPYGGPLEEYEQTAKKIEKILERGIKRIIALVTGTS